jgi:hypothetical protein
MNFLTVSFYSGLVLLILCLLVLVSPLRDKFSSATQKIQGFGLNLEVSVLTLLVLISVGLMTSGIWMQLQNMNGKLQQLEIEKTTAEEKAKRAEEDLARTSKVGIVTFVKLEGVNDITKLNFGSLSCKYITASGDERDANISAASSINRIKVNLTDLQKETVIDKLLIINNQTGEKWVSPVEWRPLQPTIELAKDTAPSHQVP